MFYLIITNIDKKTN